MPFKLNGIKDNASLAYAVALLIIILPLFKELGSHPIFQWDESRQATNVYEMLKNGNPFVTYFDGAPDHYNTKPPLMIWFQAAFWNFLEDKELALRLPSALAAVGTCFSMVWFSKKLLNNPWIGTLASLFLVSISGYIELHGTRTGDYDSFIAFFICLFTFHYILFLKTKELKHIYLFYLFFGLGIAAKGPVPLIFLPVLLIYTIYKNQLGEILKNKGFYIGLLIPVFSVILFYGIRALIDENYLDAVWYNDFNGRLTSALDGHDQPFTYYIEKLWAERGIPLLYFLPLSLILLFTNKKEYKDLFMISWTLMAFYLLIISLAVTKVYWYDTPIFPFIALLLASSIAIIVARAARVHKALARFILAMVIGVTIVFPFSYNINKISAVPSYSWEGDMYNVSKLLKSGIDSNENLNGYILFNEWDYHPQYTIYTNLLKDIKGYDVEIRDTLNFLPGDSVIIHQEKYFDSFDTYYTYRNIKQIRKIKFVEIIGKIEN